MFIPPYFLTTLITLILSSQPYTCHSIRVLPDSTPFPYTESPQYQNHKSCTPSSTVHVAMTLDSEYLRGSIAAVHSVLRHTSCPENIFFHFIAAEFDPSSPRVLMRLVRKIFPSLTFKVYIFREDAVINLISASVRLALENPLNYTRNYLGDILDPRIKRVIYLDSDVVLVDDIIKLWRIELSKNRVIGAPEYCQVNFTTYFTDNFWSDPVFQKAFQSKVGSSENKNKNIREGKVIFTPCYFNTGVMVMDLVKWRNGNYRNKIKKWMEIQRKKRIYDLGSLPPFLLVFGGNIEPIDHRWNQHGLGGDNVKGSCRSLHKGPVSLLHWSGKGKPWVRFDDKKPCPLDYVWKPYDLYNGGDVDKSQPLDLDVGFSEFIGYSNYLI